MSGFVLDKSKTTFSALSVGLNAGDGSVKRIPQVFTTFFSYLWSIWHILKLELAVSDCNSCYEAKRMPRHLGQLSFSFEWYSSEYNSEN